MANKYKKQGQTVTTKEEGIFLYFEILNEGTGIVEYVDNEIIADDSQATIDAAVSALLTKYGIILEA